MLKLRQINKDQSRDTGMAMVLLLLLIYLYARRSELLVAALAVHVLTMTLPRLFRPLAVVWLGLSHLLGTIMSRILLSVVFYTIVTPIGLLRRIAGKDPLKIREFKTGEGSVMLERNHLFAAADIEKPY